MIINFDSYTPQFKADFKQGAAQIWKEVRGILPALPADITFWFNNVFLHGPEILASGAALSPTEIIIAAQVDTPYAVLHDELKATIFHEAYHLIQGHTFSAEDSLSALEEAAQEGAALVFEMQHAGSSPSYAQYDEAFISEWLPQLKSLGPDWRKNRDKWKFWDPDTDTSHILYRVGTYIAHEALTKSKLTIVDLANKSGSEIIALSSIDS